MFTANQTETLVERAARVAGRLWRRARYQWLNAMLWTDVGIAGALFMAGFLLSFAMPTEKSSRVTTGGILLALFAAMPPLLMTGTFWYVRSYLKAEAAYEDLRAGKRPALSQFFDWLLHFPCTAVVLFAIFVGVASAAFGLGGYGPSIRVSLLQVTTPLPPVTIVVSTIQSAIGVQKDATWPSWVMIPLSFFYSTVVFALVLGWFERGKQRQNYVASLFTEEARAGRASAHFG